MQVNKSTKNMIHTKNIIGILAIIICIFFTTLFVNTHSTFADPVASPAAASGTHPVDITTYHRTDNPTVNLNDFGEFTPVTTVGEFSTKVLEFLLKILGGIAMLGVITGGIMIMGGGFSETTMENGKTLLLYSVIGVGIAMLSVLIVTLAQSFLYSFGK